MKKLPFHLSLAGAASLAAFSTLIACGGLSDPTKSSERVATISGALTGAADVPAGARVALVWRVGANGGLAVGNDVAIAGGKFTMDLTTPASSYFVPVDGDDFGPGDTATPDDAPPPTGTSSGYDPGSSSGQGGSRGTGTSSSGGSSGSGSFAFSNKLSPRDTVNGQIVTGALNVAMAGFIVYVDTNANGKLDIDVTTGATTDQLIGGNRELTLAYLKDGGALDYEKLRDRAGVAPQAGYNLLWSQGSRWLSLDLVELKIANQALPPHVCNAATKTLEDTGTPSGGSSSSGGPASSGEKPAPTTPPSGGGLTCDADGRGYCLHSSPVPTAAVPAVPPGLCSAGTPAIPAGDTDSSTTCTRLPDGEQAPADWPCPTTETMDGGAAPNVDAGQ